MNKLAISLIMLFYALPLQAGGNVVARVNGAAISALQLEVAENQLIATSTYHGSVPAEKRIEFREQALQGLIIRELQYQDAVARGFEPDKKLVKAKVKEIKNRFNSGKEYKKALSEAGLTEDDMRAGVEKNLVVEDAIKKLVVDAAHWNDAELKAYYDSNAGKFKQPESVKLRIISIAAEKKAVEALTLIRSGETFGTVAAKMSEDNYRTRGGDIGYVHRGRIYPELENEAFRMMPGEASGLLRTEGMWFIIKVEEKIPERQIAFEEAKDKLKKELEARRSAELLEKWSQELRAKAKIEILLDDNKATEVRGGE
jgi:peptidyl-prolyl cis-trans isomerase C